MYQARIYPDFKFSDIQSNFRRLNDTFGPCGRPKIGWQIDTFGHSKEQASIFAQLGFDGMFLGRVDYQDKAKRMKNKTAEFIWRANPSLGMLLLLNKFEYHGFFSNWLLYKIISSIFSITGAKADLFTLILYNRYSAPKGFCFDILCDDSEPLIDDKDSPEYNIDRKVCDYLYTTVFKYFCMHL